MTKKLSEFTGGGEIYVPSMMSYDGLTGRYELNGMTTSGSQVTVTAAFKRAAFTGDTLNTVFRLEGAFNYQRAQLFILSSDYTADAQTQNRLRVIVKNSANAIIVDCISKESVCDDEIHFVFFSYDGATGSMTYHIDGVDADDPTYSNRVLTTGTLSTAITASDLFVGSNESGVFIFTGEIGSVGYQESYLTNSTDFFEVGVGRKQVNETTWAEWGGTQPLIWNPHGCLEDNRGSAANMTKIGPVVVSDAGNLVAPTIGNFTAGDAVAADIAIGKVAWVNAKRIVGTAI